MQIFFCQIPNRDSRNIHCCSLFLLYPPKFFLPIYHPFGNEGELLPDCAIFFNDIRRTQLLSKLALNFGLFLPVHIPIIFCNFPPVFEEESLPNFVVVLIFSFNRPTASPLSREFPSIGCVRYPINQQHSVPPSACSGPTNLILPINCYRVPLTFS